MCEGGATPGKLIMGLKIVKCNQIVPLGINRVQVGSHYVSIYSCNFIVSGNIGNWQQCIVGTVIEVDC